MPTIATHVACSHCDHPVHDSTCQKIVGHGSDVGGCGCKHYVDDVLTRPCPLCGKASMVKVDHAQYRKWQEGMFVQDAFPNMTPDQRALLITGTHPECWDNRR